MDRIGFGGRRVAEGLSRVGELLIVIGLVVVVGAIIGLVIKSRNSGKNAGPGARVDPLASGQMAQGFGPKNLGPGAIVAYGGVDYVVRGSITLRQGGFVWWEHLLDGGDGARWLGVEEDEGQLELTWWTTRKGHGLQPSPELVLDDRVYREDESGEAHYTCEGTTGLPPQGRMRYRDYQTGDGSSLLSFENWDDAGWELSSGRPMSPGEMTVYPAPPAAGDPGYVK
ncbi:hypothetical protein NCCP2495_23480 [Dietzia sp. NCCP-2495]|nr:hypothetical protein NCCP2495_23480 [Dietzia sp. NCCP-2495]